MSDRRSKVVLGLFIVSAVVVLALSLFTGFTLNSLVDSLEQSRNHRLLAEAQIASRVIPAEDLESITDANDLTSAQGIALQERLDSFITLQNLSKITFIRELPSGDLQFIISNGTSTDGYDITAPAFETNALLKNAFSGSIVVVNEINTPLSANGLMAYSPVFDGQGRVVAVAAIGIDDSDIIQTNSMITTLIVILLVCVAIVILAACANYLLQLRKERELEVTAKAQQLLNQISRNLASENSYTERVAGTLEVLGTYLDAKRAYIYDLSSVEMEEHVRQYWRSDDAILYFKEKQLSALLQLMQSTFAMDRADVHAAVSAPDINNSDDPLLKELKGAQIAGFIWAPLVVQNKLWGVLALDFSKARPSFAANDIQFVENTASDLVGAITRELYNKQREIALEHALHASEVKSEFLSNMSHEMRTPMNAIIGMTSIALGNDDRDRKNYCLEHIRDASEHLLTIINDVLDISSLESNEMTLKLQPFDFRAAMEDTANAFRSKISVRNQTFTIEIDGQIPPRLIGDKQRLGQIVGNLLSNANKFTPENGTILLRAQHLGADQENHKLLIEVRDSGIGIDPALRESLFGSFSQAESGPTRQYGGTGLGLAISRHLVELMNGQIGLEENKPVGSNFFFTLTLKEDASLEESVDSLPADGGEKQRVLETTDANASLSANDADSQKLNAGESSLPLDADATGGTVSESGALSQASAEEPGVPDLSAYRILLAEDIEINREVVLALLEDTGILIDTTANGVEVFEALKNNPSTYDLVFMDLQMPEMDGLEATRKIRALDNPEYSALPIIAMTANVSQDDVDACLGAGMNGHIGKPINIKEIYRILDKYLPER